MAASSFYIRRAFSSTRLYKNLKVQDINWVKVAMKSINIAMKNNNAAMKHNDSAMKYINIAMDAERKYHAEYKEKIIMKMGLLERDFLKLRNTFNLRGVLELSLEEYSAQRRLEETAKSRILIRLIGDPTYALFLKRTLKRYKLRQQDVNACSRVLHHELSKHGHGNTSELVVDSTEHTITEVAAMETVFATLKELSCFSMPLKIRVEGQEERLL